MLTLAKAPTSPNFNITVGFNEKDQLQLTTKEEAKPEDEKLKGLKDFIDLRTTKYENISIDDISNCVNVEAYPNCNNTLVFYVTKNLIREAIALKFENEQDFKRIYFTYKYFKMRNRLTKNSPNNYISSDNTFGKKKTYELFKSRKNSIDDNFSIFDKNSKSDFDILKTDNDGLTHLSAQKNYNSRFDQPMSLIGIKSDVADLGEIDSIIYTDIDIPAKPDRKRLFHRNKPKAPLPPANKDQQQKVLKGEFVRVNVERVPDVVPKENKFNKIPDILMFREGKMKARNGGVNNIWSTNNKGKNL